MNVKTGIGLSMLLAATGAAAHENQQNSPAQNSENMIVVEQLNAGNIATSVGSIAFADTLISYHNEKPEAPVQLPVEPLLYDLLAVTEVPIATNEPTPPIDLSFLNQTKQEPVDLSFLNKPKKAQKKELKLPPPATLSVRPDALALLQQANIQEVDIAFKVIDKESGWRVDVVNSIGCIGLGQACPKGIRPVLEANCPQWKTDALCQLGVFNNYVMKRYGSWQGALDHHITHNWY